MPDNSANGWNEYSRLVLKELETLSKGIVELNNEIQGIKKELAIMKDREEKVDELRQWKFRMDEVISTTQLSTMIKEIEDLKQFKVKAVTIFAIIQFILTVISIFGGKLFGL